MSGVKKDSKSAKRDHTRAKQAGVTHMGCPRFVIQSLNLVLAEIHLSTGRKIRAFDLLHAYPEIIAIYEHIARWLAGDCGFHIEVRAKGLGKRDARTIRIALNSVDSLSPEERLVESMPAGKAEEPQLALPLIDDPTIAPIPSGRAVSKISKNGQKN
jgi:hypothetical protein